MRRIFQVIATVIGLPFGLVALYLLLALLGGLIPASFNTSATASIENGDDDKVTIYLTGTLLHTDIAVPVNAETRERFAFLETTHFPVEADGLAYFVIGWGSEAFYTSTADYSDMELAIAWKAVTGDKAVLHIGPAGNLSKSQDVTAISINRQGLTSMLDYFESYLIHEDGQPALLKGQSFGYGDVFYRARGNFNLLNPCNVWASGALRQAGLVTGIWTPTSYSLLLNQALYQ